jgi:pimeloyl-ACP methyl ester carboxylesterase
LLLPLIGTPGSRMLGRVTFGVLKALNTNLGLDAAHLMRVFDALPDAAARRAFVRTLRAAVDWKGQAITMLDRCYLTQGMPTLLIWGARDAVIPVAHAHKAHGAMPGSRLEVFADVGHFPHQDEPERFLTLFRQFYDNTEPNTHSTADWRAVLRRGASVAPVAERRLQALSPLRSV